MKFLLFLALLPVSASGQLARTSAYSIDGIDTISHEDTNPYDISDGTLELQYSHTLGNSILVQAEARLEHHNDPYGDVKVYFDELYVMANVNGHCDTLGWTGVTVGNHLKLDVGSQEVEPSDNPPPPNDTVNFPGGSVTFNAQTVAKNQIEVTGIILTLDSGETHTYGYTKAAFDCPIPVELMQFNVE